MVFRIQYIIFFSRIQKQQSGKASNLVIQIIIGIKEMTEESDM